MIMQRRSADADEFWLASEPRSVRKIAGIAATGAVNANGGIHLMLGMAPPLLPIPLRVDHDLDAEPIGEVTWCRRTDTQLQVRGLIYRTRAGDDVWDAIRAGELHSMSVGSACFDDDTVTACSASAFHGATLIKRWRIREISLTDHPADKGCRFAISHPVVQL